MHFTWSGMMSMYICYIYGFVLICFNLYVFVSMKSYMKLQWHLLTLDWTNYIHEITWQISCIKKIYNFDVDLNECSIGKYKVQMSIDWILKKAGSKKNTNSIFLICRTSHQRTKTSEPKDLELPKMIGTIIEVKTIWNEKIKTKMTVFIWIWKFCWFFMHMTF